MTHEPQPPILPAPIPKEVELPAPTVMPMVLALGLALLAFGMVSTISMSVAGLLFIVVGGLGWICEFAPGQGTVMEPVYPPELRPAAVQPRVSRIETLPPGTFGHRMQFPEKVHPYSAGVKGGAVGGVAMAVLALLYGVLSGRGIWFPVNLLAAMALPEFAQAHTVAELSQYSTNGLVVGLVIHISSSLLLGLLYGLLLPMMPSRPLLWGGGVAPFLWTGAIHSFMGVLNPKMNDLVEWHWFILSQFAFGIAAGLVVVYSVEIQSSEVWKTGLFSFRRRKKEKS